MNVKGTLWLLKNDEVRLHNEAEKMTHINLIKHKTRKMLLNSSNCCLFVPFKVPVLLAAQYYFCIHFFVGVSDELLS